MDIGLFMAHLTKINTGAEMMYKKCIARVCFIILYIWFDYIVQTQ